MIRALQRRWRNVGARLASLVRRRSPSGAGVRADRPVPAACGGHQRRTAHQARRGQAVRDALNGSPTVITVRDRLGYHLLEYVGVSQEIQLTADPAFLLDREELPAGLLASEGVGHFEFGVGMRLHFCIFCTLAGTPFTALPYASKVSGLRAIDRR
jgi:polysaccharide pyruvyl transferase WcaK-like protein